MQHPSGSIQQPLPQQHMPQQQPVPAVMHPSALPAVRPPAVHVLEQHTYVHLPSQEEPLITHSSCAMPRQITCPMCFRQGPTMVTRQPGCCAYLVSVDGGLGAGWMGAADMRCQHTQRITGIHKL